MRNWFSYWSVTAKSRCPSQSQTACFCGPQQQQQPIPQIGWQCTKWPLAWALVCLITIWVDLDLWSPISYLAIVGSGHHHRLLLQMALEICRCTPEIRSWVTVMKVVLTVGYLAKLHLFARMVSTDELICWELRWFFQRSTEVTLKVNWSTHSCLTDGFFMYN